MRNLRPPLACALAALCLGACGPLPSDQTPLATIRTTAYRPLALGSTIRGSVRWDQDEQRTYLALPGRLVSPKNLPSAQQGRGFSRTNWSYSVKQQGRVQAYIVQTPDWFELVEQELPRYQKDFNQLEEAIAFANERYADWDLVSLEP